MNDLKEFMSIYLKAKVKTEEQRAALQYRWTAPVIEQLLATVAKQANRPENERGNNGMVATEY